MFIMDVGAMSWVQSQHKTETIRNHWEIPSPVCSEKDFFERLSPKPHEDLAPLDAYFVFDHFV